MTEIFAIVDLIEKYYEVRGLKWPTAEQAMLWAVTELGEAADLLLQKDSGWVRNNPDKEQYSPNRFSEELGDVILMLIVASMVLDECSNPLIMLRVKLEEAIRQAVK